MALSPPPPSAGEPAAYLVLSPGAAAHVLGSVHVRVLAGSVEVQGAVLSEGGPRAGASLVAPPHGAALPLRCATARDVRMQPAPLAAAGGDEDGSVGASAAAPPVSAAAVLLLPPAVLAALHGEAAAAGVVGAGAAFQRAVVAVWPLLTSSTAGAAALRASAAALPLDAPVVRGGPSPSLAVRGACLLRCAPDEAAAPPAGGAVLLLATPAALAMAAADATADAAAAAAAGGTRRAAAGRACTTRFVLPARWASAAAAICARAVAPAAPPVVAFVLGAKGAGKSTFARLLVNRLLDARRGGAVAYLDLDAGQPEHTPPGMLALALVTAPLLSPPHLRTAHAAADAAEAAALGAPHALAPAARLLAARYIGDDSPAGDKDLFCAAARALFAEHAAHADCRGGVPLVVNGHGWLRGAGHETLQDALLAAQPTDVVFLDASRSGEGAAGAWAPIALAADEAAARLHGLLVPATPHARIHGAAAWHVVAAAGVIGGPDAAGSRAARSPRSRSGSAASLESSGSGGSSGGSSFIEASDEAQVGAPASGVLPRNQPPPRAARSPADGRGARLLTYLLWGAAAAIARTRDEDLLGAALDDGRGGAGALALPADVIATLRARAVASRASLLGGALAALSAVLADERPARAICIGTASPAYYAAACPAAIVSLASVRLVATASDAACACGSADACDDDQDGLARALQGQLVGLLSRRGSGECAHRPAALLACHGLAYVRHYDEHARELHLLTPVSPAKLAAAGVDTLASWRGAHDVPTQLLCRAAPGGDAFTASAADVVRAGTSSDVAAASSGGRKQPRRGEGE